MKNVILSIVAILTINFATAQTANQAQIEAAGKIVMSRIDNFDAAQTATYVNTGMTGLNQIEETLDKQKLNYRKYSFVFYGEIKEDNIVGGAMNSYTQSKSKPFVYYTIVRENGNLVVWVLAGHNGF